MSHHAPISIPIDPITASSEGELELPHTFPSFSNDRESSSDVDIDAPSSPLHPRRYLLCVDCVAIGIVAFVCEGLVAII